MEKHQCKLCSRRFSNGRALGGHMKAHMAVLPLPPKPHHQLAHAAESTRSADSSFLSSEDEHEDDQNNKGLLGFYKLRENPKRSLRLADPDEVYDASASVVIQDRESETESRNPTRRRSKRSRRICFTDHNKPKLATSSVIDSSPPAESSVSDTSPEEDVAICLMMLSRDVSWMGANYGEAADQEETKVVVEVMKDEKLEEIKVKKTRGGKNRCGKCSKLFRSHQAMCVHMKICFESEEEANNAAANNVGLVFKCPFCSKIFGSGQALGGHKRSHLSSGSGYPNAVAKVKEAFRKSFIDLNMPAPQEEDDFSVVSDA